MKKYLFLLLLFTSSFLSAQDESKYLAGAVPVVDGKVTFTYTFENVQMSQQQIYDTLLKWAQNRFKTEEKQNWGRVLYSNLEKGQIVCQGSEYLVFADKALSLDRAKTNYRVAFFIFPYKCTMEISNISYIYREDNEKLPAEEWITDEYALNKDKTKLSYGVKKFRIKTIDLVEELENNVSKILGSNTESASLPQQQTVKPVISAKKTTITASNESSMPGYKQIAPDKIPGNIIKLLSEDWMLITANNGNGFNMMTASWGGLGHLYGKPVAFCFINPSRYTYQLMEKGDTYTLSFYTETYRDALKYCGSHSGKDEDKVKGSGLTPITTPMGSKSFGEAWMIIECRKMLSQSFTPEAFNDEKLKNEWSGKPLHKMYIGEIINVWVK